MASIASSSSTSTLTASRPQAGPLPSKQGEIGYSEDLHGRGRDLESGVVNSGDGGSVRSVTPLPARHPADRDAPPAIDASAESATTDVPLTPAPGAVAAPAPAPAEASTTDSSSSSLHSTSKRFFRARKVPTYGGVRATTLAIFTIQCLCIIGTIAGWALAVMSIAKNNKNQSSDTSNTSNGTNGVSGFSSTSIFVHVVFAIAVIAQLLFLERRIFTLRAERYSYVHPGEVLPTSNRRGSASMGYAPWHRPPLPTYAAALAQSGHGTGDVEDNAIAVPPPPAYGNTRDSRLLLQGFLRNSLRAQRPVSEHSQMSQQDGERPLSYASQDQQWQEIQDAERAIKLEETLGKLEEGGAHVGPTTSSSPSAVHSAPVNMGTDGLQAPAGEPDRTSGSSLSSFWQRVARG